MNLEDYVLPVFGQFVHVSRKLVRTIYGTERYWKETPYLGHGVFLGVRHITNGVTYGTHGRLAQYLSYKSIERFPVALVSPGPDENPIYVPLSAIQI
jgi:hypothetical protein